MAGLGVGWRVSVGLLESVCWIVGECLLVLRLSVGSVGSVIIPMKLLLTFRQL